MPASRPRVHTFVAMKARDARPAASRSPTMPSARPYIGELSMTLPPEANKASSTPDNLSFAASSGGASNPT